MRLFFSRLYTLLVYTIVLVEIVPFLVNIEIAYAQTESQPTIAVLSHTDFLPDATGTYARRSLYGREKAFVPADTDEQIKSDEAYDNVYRPHGYDSEAVGLPEFFADAILEQLAKSKRFIPVDRKALRSAILEQRFGKQITATYLDRTLDKAIQNMDRFEIGGGLAMDDAVAGSKYNDLLKDFKDLGSAVGSRFLVLGNLHQLGSSVEYNQIPFSESGKTVAQKTAKARLRLRVIDTASSTIIGADSVNVTVSDLLFRDGKKDRDDFEFMDQVARQAANVILDIIFPAKIVDMAPLVISRGGNDGIVKGDIFTIVREGKAIKESSGAVIARLKSEIGSVKTVQVQDTVSVVSIVDGGDFIKGDFAVRSTPVKSKPDIYSASPLKNTEPIVSNKLPRVAVGLIKAVSTAVSCPNIVEYVPIFTDTIITRLLQTKRFTVIDRQEVDQLLNEQLAQALTNNNDLPSVMGSLKGCDYVLLGSLQNFSKEVQTIKFPNSMRFVEILDGFSEGNMRIVDVQSGDIIESQKISVQHQLDTNAGEDRLIAALADQYAAQVVANLLNAVYPVKIAALAPNGTVHLNRGNDGLLKKGMLLEVMRPGQKIIDPDTGVQLGLEESKVGQIEIMQVENNRSVGRVVEGSGIQRGDLLKNISEVTQVAASSPGSHSKTGLTGQGSVLPLPSKGKATLALAKITLNARKRFYDGSRISAIQEGTMDQITDILTDSLDKTHRFLMMERREIDQIIDEKLFQTIASGADVRTYLKELEGADYLVVGELTNFYVYAAQKKVPYVDNFQINVTGFIEGNLRIVDSHTGKIVATEKIRIKKKFSNMGLDEIRTKLIDQYAQEAADGIVKRIFPTKIIGVMPDGTVFINRGTDAGIRVGSILTVERPGEELIDKDTGLSFGAAETTIGSVEIISVEEMRSRAKVIAGAAPQTGDILRDQEASPKNKAKKKVKISW